MILTINCSFPDANSDKMTLTKLFKNAIAKLQKK